jgi:hypothetical protein
MSYAKKQKGRKWRGEKCDKDSIHRIRKYGRVRREKTEGSRNG